MVQVNAYDARRSANIDDAINGLREESDMEAVVAVVGDARAQAAVKVHNLSALVSDAMGPHPTGYEPPNDEA